LQAGQNLALVASDASAGKEAYLYAGANLSLDTAANSTYSYFYKKSSSWNSSKMRQDETSSLTSVLSNGTSTYTIYTRSSTGSAGAQYFGPDGASIKFSLKGR
jgi:hypothetical protein